MIYEKSCGAVVFRDEISAEGMRQRYVLMIRHSAKSRYSFPKGHVEIGENEIMTAEREVLEETAVRIRITDKFRRSVYYRPRRGVKKEVVYFIALTTQTEVKPQEGEIYNVAWIPAEKAGELLAYANDRRVLVSALERIEQKVTRHSDLSDKAKLKKRM